MTFKNQNENESVNMNKITLDLQNKDDAKAFANLILNLQLTGVGYSIESFGSVVTVTIR